MEIAREASDCTAPTVAIVIPAANRREDLRRCLRSLMAQDYDAREVVVVDNGSTDGTAEMVEADFPTVSLIRNPTNKGACLAKNQGINQSRSDYVWFLDSDTEVPNPDCLSGMVDRMEKDPAIGSIGGEMCHGPDGRLEIKKKNILPSGETAVVTLRDSEAHMVESDYLSTCNCLVRRDLLERLGGFDPGYFFLSEDKDLGRRIARLGYRNIIDRRTSAIHHVSREGGKRDLFLKHRNIIRFALINLPWYLLLVQPLLTLFYLFRGSKFTDLEKGRKNVTKYLGGRVEGMVSGRSSPFAARVAAVGTLYLISLLAAYAWNIIHLPRTLHVRWRGPDFLAGGSDAIGDRLS